MSGELRAMSEVSATQDVQDHVGTRREYQYARQSVYANMQAHEINLETLKQKLVAFFSVCQSAKAVAVSKVRLSRDLTTTQSVSNPEASGLIRRHYSWCLQPARTGECVPGSGCHNRRLPLIIRQMPDEGRTGTNGC